MNQKDLLMYMVANNYPSQLNIMQTREADVGVVFKRSDRLAFNDLNLS